MTIDELKADNLRVKAELAGLRAVLDNAGAYLYTKNLQGQYTYVNPLTCDLFGAAYKDIIGQDDARFFSHGIAAQLQANDQLVLETAQTHIRQEQLVLQETGETRFYLAVKGPLYNELGQLVGLCGVSTDITEQKRLEARLEESQLLLNTVLDNVEAKVYMKDKQGRYLYANKGVLNVTHLTSEQIIGHTDAELHPTEMAQSYKAADDQVFASGQTLHVEETYTDATGSTTYFWSTKLLLRQDEKPDVLIGMSTDITPLKYAEVAAARSQARFRTLFEYTREALVLMSPTDNFLDCNQAALTLTGVQSKAEFLLLTPVDLSPHRQSCGMPSTQKAVEVTTQSLVQGHHEFEWLLRRYDNGNLVPLEVMVTVIELDGGAALLMTLRDLTERKRYEAQINQLAYYDVLTQLPNRRLLYDRLSHALVQHHRSHQHGAVIYLDLDNFKPLNDRHGHVAGDHLLQEAARRLVSCVRQQDTVARLGGDEFVILLIQLDESWPIALKEANRLAEKIRDALAHNYVLTIEQNGRPTKVVEHQCTASLGVTVFRPVDNHPDTILRLADDAMYRAKAKGRNQIRFGNERQG